MCERIEQTPYTRRKDADLLSLTAPVRAERPERTPVKSSNSTVRESLQWVRLDMEIRLFANRLTEASSGTAD